MQHLTRTQSGRSMIEMLGVLAIIAVISIGAIAGMNQAMVKYRTSRTYSDILSISQNVSDYYSYKRTYLNMTMTDLCDEREKIMPTKCTDGVSGKSVPNPFGGGYVVSAAADGEQMNIQASNVPIGSCEELLGLDWGRDVVKDSAHCNGSGDTLTFSINFY